MCEFCSIGPNSNQPHGRDESDLRFAGFFSADAIEAAVRQSSNSQVNNNNNAAEGGDEDGEGGEEEDDDGT